LIHCVVEQEVLTQGIKISKRVELVFIIIRKTIVLPKAKPIVLEGVPMVGRMKYCEPKVNQNGSTISAIPKGLQ
jgi:hypothetical protein